MQNTGFLFRYILYTYILIDWVGGNSKFVVPETLTIDRSEAEVNSQGLGGLLLTSTDI
jgi:hypothetical protein